MINKITNKFLKSLILLLIFGLFTINTNNITKAESTTGWLDRNFWSGKSSDDFWPDFGSDANDELKDIVFGSGDGYGHFTPSVYTKTWGDSSKLPAGASATIRDFYDYTFPTLITGHILDFAEQASGNLFCYDSRNCYTIYLLDTDYVIISGYVSHGGEHQHSFIGIISMRSGGTNVYTNQDVFFAANALGNMILDNLHIDGGYSFTGSTKSKKSSAVFGNGIIYNGEVPKLGDTLENITMNNCTITNMSGFIVPISNQSNSAFGGLLFNNITTINNNTKAGHGLFHFDNKIPNGGNSVIFNNRKSFDNLGPGQYNLYTNGGGISINNTYFNPGKSNIYNIFFDYGYGYNDSLIINNILGTVYNNNGNYDCHVHNIIGDIQGYLCNLYGYRKHFSIGDPEPGIDYLEGDGGDWYIDDEIEREDGDLSATDIGCLTYNYIINPFTGAINTTAKYPWTSNTYYMNPGHAGCLDKTKLNNGNSNVYSNLKYSFGKDIPTQVAPVRLTGSNLQRIRYAGIPYDTGKYIASEINKLSLEPDIITETGNFNSDPSNLTEGHSKVRLNIPCYVAKVFGPQTTSLYTISGNISDCTINWRWTNSDITFNPNTHGNKLLISSIIVPKGHIHFIKPSIPYNAPGAYCGNGILETGENCEKTGGDRGGCNTNCTLKSVSCYHNITFNPASSTAPADITISGTQTIPGSISRWNRMVRLSFGDGTPDYVNSIIPDRNRIDLPTTHNYTSPGTYIVTGFVINAHSYVADGVTRPTAYCTGTITITSIPDNTPPTVTLTTNAQQCKKSTNYTVTGTFSEPVQGVDKKDLKVTNGTIGPFVVKSNTVAVWTVKSNINGNGTVTAKIQAETFSDLAGNDNTGGSNTLSWTYDNDGPTPPTLTSPSNNGEINTRTPQLSRNSTSDIGCNNNVAGYEVEMCTSARIRGIGTNPSTSLCTTIWSGTTSTTSITVPNSVNIMNGNTYNRKVRAKDGLGNRGEWSSENKFTVNIDTVGPTCERGTPSTSTCISGGVAGTITLTCTDDTGIATNSLSINDISYSGTLFTVNAGTVWGNSTARTYTFNYTSNTNANGTGRFILKNNKVRDISNNPASSTSSSQIRVDNQAPSTPSMNQEPEFTSGTSNTVYSYTTTDRGCSPTVQYQFCKSITNNTSSCSSSSNISSWLDETSHTFTNLSNQEYYYFVRTRDGLGNIGSWSSSTYSTQDSIKPTITFDKNSGAAAGSHSVVVTVTDTGSKLENNSKIRYKRTTDSTCGGGTYIHTGLSQHTDYATTTITTPSNIANGSYYLCIQGGMTSDNAGNTNNQTKTSGVFIIQLVCEITEASQCTNSQLELTLTANKDIQTPDGRTPKTLGGGGGGKVDKKIFTQNVTSNNTVSVTITDFSGSTATCSITPTKYDNVGPSFIFNNATGNECTGGQLIITGVNDTGCATGVTNGNIGEKIYKFNRGSWGKSAIYTISAQQPGTITVTGEVRDNLGNISRKTATYTVVNVAPTANNFSTGEIGKTPRNITLSQFITASNAREGDCGTTHLTFSGVKTNGNIGTCSINNSILTYTPQANKQGSDTCKITIKDNENSTIDVTVTFNDIDTVPPTITITNNPTNFNQCTTGKTVTASINETGTILYYTTGGTCNNSGPYETGATNTRSFTKSFGSESDMGLYVCFKAIDLAGNEYYKTGTQIIKIDRTAPTFAMSGNFEGNTNNYPELYECETGFAEIINVNDTGCASIPTNAYSWDNGAFGNIKKNNFSNNTTGIKTVDIKVKDNLLNTSGATINFIWRNRAISFLNTETNTIHLENDMIDVVTINPIDIFGLTGRGTCEAIVITPIYCSGATQTLQGTFPNYTLKIEPDEDLDSSGYCDISFKDCTKGNTTNCDSTLQGHIEFEVKTKDYYVVLDSVPGKSSGHIHNENDFDTGKISLIASKTISGKPDFSDKYTIKGVTREREETLYHGTQRPDITNINVEIENFRFDDEDFNLCISGNIIVKIDTGFITDPAGNPSKATDITTNQTYELRQHLCASGITDDLLPGDNNKFEKIESTLRNSGFDLILLSTTGLSLGTDSIECIGDSYSCPGFHCRDIGITGSVTNIQTTGCINDSSVYGYTKQYTLHIDPIDDEAFTYHEGPWSGQRRSDWTGCQIKIKDGNCPYAYTNINMHIKMSAYKYGLIGSEDFYDLNLGSAISEGGGDNGFFFYISNPQIINIGGQSGLVGKINYEMYFDSGVADEFYTIQGTGIVNGYQQNLEIKRPTFNYSNPRSYLFNFPYYD